MVDLTRRGFVIGAAALGLAGCASQRIAGTAGGPAAAPPDLGGIYGAIDTEPFPIPAVRPSEFDPAFARQLVAYPSTEAPATIIVDPANHYLYSVRGGGMAMRYGVGVGREGFGWSGSAEVGAKRTWPDWYPPKEMLQRQPEIVPQLSNLQGGLGMPGGPKNPLGARAIYLYQDGRDTLYRIHGTFEPWTIGRSVSSGCIRMINQDAIDLYNRTPEGTRVIVLAGGSPIG